VASAPLIVVVGAGISGLACAHALQKRGQNVLVVEASSRPGGGIQSIEKDGYLLEQGPQSFSGMALLYELCAELGLNQQLIEAPHGLPRFVLLDKKLLPVPMSPPAFLSSDLLSWKTKFAILAEVLRTSHPPEPDESIGAFTRRKFSAELLDRLVGPFVSGIYAGDPEQLSLRAAFPRIYQAEQSSGSVVRGMIHAAKTSKVTVTQSRPNRRPCLISFRSGNETLTNALADKLGSRLRLNFEVSDIRQSENGFLLRSQKLVASEEISCERLVIATPTTVAASLLEQLVPRAVPSLREIAYAPVAVVSLGYRREQVRHSLNGFGFLAPRSSGIRTLGTVWNSSLFPERAPQDHVLFTSFVGGATDASATDLSDDALSAMVHAELAPLLAISGLPAMQHVTLYTRAIPQYNLGHTERLQTIREAAKQLPGLWLAGNYWRGPAVGSCIEHAIEVAEQVRISYKSQSGS
jgi:protoporphyrinogen/coproporphyrinogen III oxidase